jgi:hypothetical protein
VAKKGRGVLLVYADLIDDKYEEEFNAWYDTEHLPQLLSMPGFMDAARYVAVKGGPKYLAVYELDDVEALQRPEFANRKRPPWDARMSPQVVGKNFARIVGRQIFPQGVIVGRQIFPQGVENADRGMAPALQIGRMSVPEDRDEEWNAWYNGSYIPGYRKVPGVIYARRYQVVDGDVGYTTVYEFESPEVSESAEWDHQRLTSSPKSDEMRDVMTHIAGSPGVYRRMDL